MTESEKPKKNKTRPDTRLPQSRAGGQGQWWKKSLGHLGGSGELKKLINAEKVIVPYVSVCGCVMVRGVAAPKGPRTYALEFILGAKIGSSRLRLKP